MSSDDTRIEVSQLRIRTPKNVDEQISTPKYQHIQRVNKNYITAGLVFLHSTNLVILFNQHADMPDQLCDHRYVTAFIYVMMLLSIYLR